MGVGGGGECSKMARKCLGKMTLKGHDQVYEIFQCRKYSTKPLLSAEIQESGVCDSVIFRVKLLLFRKRKSAATESMADVESAAKKPCLNGAGDVASVANHDNKSDDECVDDKESVRNTLIVRLPTQAPNAPASSVIVIDDSDDETDVPPSDVKPDKRLLDVQLVEPSASDAHDAVDRKPVLGTADQSNHNEREPTAPEHNSSESPGHSRQTSGKNVDANGSGKVQACSSSHQGAENVQPVLQPADSGVLSQHRSSKSSTGATHMQNLPGVEKSSGRRSVADRYRQSEVVKQDAAIQTDAGSAEQRLDLLRSNVLQLLKTIVPTLTCSNLEFVDELVVEMVRVNAESSEIDS